MYSINNSNNTAESRHVWLLSPSTSAKFSHQDIRYLLKWRVFLSLMGVSENSGTPKSSILIGFSIINHPFWGTSIFGNTFISWLFCGGGNFPNHPISLTSIHTSFFHDRWRIPSKHWGLPTYQQSIGRVDTQIDQLGEVPPRFSKKKFQRVANQQRGQGTLKTWESWKT